MPVRAWRARTGSSTGREMRITGGKAPPCDVSEPVNSAPAPTTTPLAAASVPGAAAPSSLTLIGKSPMPINGGLDEGSQPGCDFTWFHMPSMAFHTDDAPVIDSLSTCTCKRPGQATVPTLLAIHAAFGGSMNSRLEQRQVGSMAAACRASSSASIACGCIGPMITVVIWLRSISATGTSALSLPGARTSAW